MKSFLKFSIPVLAAMALSAVSFGAEEKVTICHFPPGNPANVQIITVGASAVPAHLANHGDVLANLIDPQADTCPAAPLGRE